MTLQSYAFKINGSQIFPEIHMQSQTKFLTNKNSVDLTIAVSVQLRISKS